MQILNTDKLKELGFKEEDSCFYKEVGESKDRFRTTIIFDKEEEKFLFTRQFTSRAKFIDENDILTDHNELHTEAKKEWLKIKKIMELKAID